MPTPTMATTPPPTISALIPVFNGAATLARALDSLHDGTQLPDEIIVVDDGSRDETAAILASYQARLPGLKILRLAQNQGLVAALNAGLAAANSRYIARLDADDEWLPGHVEALRAHIALADSAKLLSTGYLQWHAERETASCPQPDISGLIRDNFIAHSSVCIDREALLRLGGYRNDLFEDYATWLDLVDHPGDYRAIAQTTVRIHILPSSLSRIDTGRSLRARYRLQRAAYRKYSGHVGAAQRLRYLLYLAACRLRLCLV